MAVRVIQIIRERSIPRDLAKDQLVVILVKYNDWDLEKLTTRVHLSLAEKVQLIEDWNQNPSRTILASKYDLFEKTKSYKLLQLSEKIELIEDWENDPNIGINNLALKYGIHRCTVHRIIKKRDFHKKQYQEENLFNKKEMSIEEKIQLIDEREGYNPPKIDELALKYKISTRTVSRILKHRPVQILSCRQYNELSLDSKIKLIEEFESSLRPSTLELSNKYGIGQQFLVRKRLPVEDKLKVIEMMETDPRPPVKVIMAEFALLNTRQYKELPLETKVRLIKASEQDPKPSIRQLADEFDVQTKTAYNIVRKKDKYLADFEKRQNFMKNR
ncbi:hypothetical protein LOTGIDRAFT_159558 [Lottia gigantea]|uniref:HTH psq-type domain-containing protein n=1 Tax=Lottia gigantea TaxID=225164 RepID=V4ASU5_LOTGI|nr:hypothetical protein LOTGIDRAFT_159558 [Lottia gigantea]ESO96816.1 hypothetical protein LOTGIDRAFT_159558 [Lottia gigantea]